MKKLIATMLLLAVASTMAFGAQKKEAPLPSAQKKESPIMMLVHLFVR